MQISTHVEELQRQLVAAAAAGTPVTEEVAGRLAVALDAAARLAILEALSDAAGEITRELAPGSVDVRLRGREVDFVVMKPAAEGAASALSSPITPAFTPVAGGAEDDDASTSRTTLRLPEALKVRAEAAAGVDGISLNAWLVKAVSATLDPAAPRGAEAQGYTGWVR